MMSIGHISKRVANSYFIFGTESSWHKDLSDPKKGYRTWNILEHFSHHLRVLKGGGGSPKNDMNHE